MTNQLLVCISASWDTVVNCPQNNTEKKNGWFAGVKKYFIVGRIFLFPDWLILRVSQSVWAQMDASAHRPPGSVKERFNCDITTQDVASFHRALMQKKRHNKNLKNKSSNSPRVTLHPNENHAKKQTPHNWLNKIYLRGQHRNISIA